MRPEDERYLDTLLGSGIRPGLDRVRTLLGAVSNPHRSVPSIIVAGTNGKGSTAALTASILRASGYRTGLYTSPHLVRIDERWMIDGREAGDEALANAVRFLRLAARRTGIRPTYFEALTVLAFILFAAEMCEATVLEVGMGGRLDATNVVRPVSSVITSVGIDHCEFLGRSVRSIAREKAGVIHRGAVVLTASNDPIVLDVIRRRAARFDCEVHEILNECQVESPVANSTTLRFRLVTPQASYQMRPRLLGTHQIRNVMLAVRTAESISPVFPRIDVASIEQGVRSARWRGRLERFRVKGKTVFVDGGHNVDASRTLADFVAAHFRGRTTLVLGMLDDKDAEGFSRELVPHFDLVIVTEPPDTPRARRAGDLERLVRPMANRVARRKNADEAIRFALAGRNRMILICGSLYLAGRAVVILDRLSPKA